MDLHEAEQILEVTAGASEKTIQEAFRDKAQETHPDISDEPGTEEEFQRIVKAREILLSTDPTDVGNDDSDSQDTAQTQATQTASTRSTGSREHTTRAATGAAAGTDPSGTSSGGAQNVSRVVSDTWTGLSPRELLVVIRDNTIPYWHTLRFWFVRFVPVLAALIVGAVALTATGGLVGGIPQLGVVLLSQILAARFAIRRSSRFNGIPPEGRVEDIHAHGHPRNYLPIIGCGMVLYLAHRATGATFGGIMPSMVIATVLVAMTLALAAVIYGGIRLTGRSVDPILIILGSLILSAFMGFSSFYTPLFFGEASSMYVFFPSIMILNFDVGLLGNIALSTLLLYSTTGLFIFSSGKVSWYLHRDWSAGLNVNPAVWHAAVVLPITITFWLGANPAVGHAVVHIIREPGLLYAVCVGSPGYIYVLYRLRRGLEMWLIHGKFNTAYVVGRRYYDN